MIHQKKKITRAAYAGIAGNGLLAAVKIVAGIFSGSLSVIADGIDSAGDIMGSLIILVTARIISKPPDLKFPYGYMKADTVATKALAFIIFFAGAQLAINTVKQLISGIEREVPSVWAVYAILFSIAGKLLLSLYTHKAGKKTDSEMLKAYARNMQGDMIISISVLTGLFFTLVFELPLIDVITALGVSIWIMRMAFQIFMQTNVELMDGIKDPSLYNKIFEAVERVAGVSNPHRLRVRKIANYHMIAIDIEVDGKMSVLRAHEKAQEVEKNIHRSIDYIYDIVVHIEPSGYSDRDEKFGVRKKDLTVKNQ